MLERVARQESFSAALFFPWSAAVFTAAFDSAAADGRSFNGVERRGRWISSMGVRRCEKSSRVVRRLATLPLDQQLLVSESADEPEGGLQFGRVGKYAKRFQGPNCTLRAYRACWQEMWLRTAAQERLAALEAEAAA
ncbi:unnamed protein product, partial [Prorocentrum cordatum]